MRFSLPHSPFCLLFQLFSCMYVIFVIEKKILLLSPNNLQSTAGWTWPSTPTPPCIPAPLQYDCEAAPNSKLEFLSPSLESRQLSWSALADWDYDRIDSVSSKWRYQVALHPSSLPRGILPRCHVNQLSCPTGGWKRSSDGLCPTPNTPASL